MLTFARRRRLGGRELWLCLIMPCLPPACGRPRGPAGANDRSGPVWSAVIVADWPIVQHSSCARGGGRVTLSRWSDLARAPISA